MSFHSSKNTKAPPGTHCKEIVVTGFTISLNIGKEDQTRSRNKEWDDIQKGQSLPTPPSPYSTTKRTADYRDNILDTRMNYIPESEREFVQFYTDDKIDKSTNYFLFPTNFTIQVASKIDSSNITAEIPNSTVNIMFEHPVILLLNPQQIKFLEALNNHFMNLIKIYKIIHLRPLKSVAKDVRGWWQYAIKAVIEKCDRDQVYKKRWATMKMRRYITLFKRNQHIVKNKFVIYDSE